MIERVRHFVNEAVRILRLTRKPRKDEYTRIAKITGLGILLIGFVGYIVRSLKYILGGP